MGTRKRYDFSFAGRDFTVEAEPEGEARYMVRMAEPRVRAGAFIRVGYLTGARHHWLVEHGAGRALLATPATSAKEACYHLARWAFTQSGFARPAPATRPVDRRALQH